MILFQIMVLHARKGCNHMAKEEWENLRCKNFTSSWGGPRYLSLAFTEQGIYMLMTVLRGDLAVKQSRVLIRTFKQMKDYIIENQDLLDALVMIITRRIKALL